MTKRKADEGKRKVGCPPMYNTVEEMQAKIDEYFEKCEGTLMLDDDGEPKLNKWNEVIIIGAKPMTVIGLAYHLGFNSRQTLLNYQNKQDFVDAITRAKMRIEAYANERLFDKEGMGGAKFTLINNFEGYSDKKDVEMSGSIENVIKVTVPKFDEE